MNMSIIRSFVAALLLIVLQTVVAHAQSPAAPTPAAPAPDQSQQLLKPEELDALVAPIALYPDTLLSQILMASTYPLEVVQAERWVEAEQEAQRRRAEMPPSINKAGTTA